MTYNEVDAEKLVECVLQWAKENPSRSNIEARILADAEALKAADELAEALSRLSAMVRILPPDMDQPGSALGKAHSALAAYRKARGTA